MQSMFFSTIFKYRWIPIFVTEDNAEKMKSKALNQLMKELDKGISCKESYSEKDTLKMLGLTDENNL